MPDAPFQPGQTLVGPLFCEPIRVETVAPAGADELRLIEVTRVGGESGNILLTPNERRVAQDCRGCCWLYIVKRCDTSPILMPFKDPAQFPWGEVVKVQHHAITLHDLPGLGVADTP